MILRLALRSLATHPVRSAVLACGFGLGVAVMATLLGVGEVILIQARAPALRGGGDVVVAGATGQLTFARHILSSVMRRSPLETRVAAAAPASRASLYLVRGERALPIRARGGVPSLERALGDPETSPVASWTDTPADAAWSAPDPADVLRSMDRFHAIPAVPARAGSWAEWLYFNGRAGDTRFYLTFLVGPRQASGRQAAGVRLQLERGARLESFAQVADVDEAGVLTGAPDLTIGDSSVRLDGLRYHIHLDLPPGARAPRLTGELSLEAVAGRSIPPLTIRGSSGWLSGYVVPMMSGRLRGFLAVAGERVPLDGGSGYHDHNWGFWEGVTWQWGQVQHGDLSLVYGRVRPPVDAADPERIPGFLAALGPDGPVGYSGEVAIRETNDPVTLRPRGIVVEGRGASLAITMELNIQDAVTTTMPKGAFGGGMDFLQLRGRYRVAGQAGNRRIDFEAPGAAETFRGR
jgi:hypothetical protein